MMKTFLKLSAIGALALLAWQQHEKQITVKLSVKQCELIYNTLEYRRQILLNSSEPGFMIQPLKDSLAAVELLIQNEYKLQTDTTRHK